MNLIDKAFKVAREEGYISLFKKTSLYTLKKIADIYPLGYIRALIATSRLKEYLNKLGDTDDINSIVNLAFNFSFLGVSIKPSQILYEIKTLLKIVKKIKPKTILEIGTERGGTLFLFCRVADPEAIIISIDLPGGPFGGGYPIWKIPFYKSFVRDHQKIHLIRADSHNSQTLNKVKKILGDKLIDFLFIDGDHTYEGVKKDFEMYSSLVRKGGIIAFHDIVPHPPETGCEVSKFWNEVKQYFKYIEIIQDQNQNWAGIGVLYV